MMQTLESVISGGQTGADRAALDAAMTHGIPVAGFCPAGRLAEDGTLDPRYPLQEANGGYDERTRLNVQHSDGTVIFYAGTMSGGTLLTHQFAQQLSKPICSIDRLQHSLPQAAQAIEEFIRRRQVARLNIAGPRATQDPAIYDYVFHCLERVIQSSFKH